MSPENSDSNPLNNAIEFLRIGRIQKSLTPNDILKVRDLQFEINNVLKQDPEIFLTKKDGDIYSVRGSTIFKNNDAALRLSNLSLVLMKHLSVNPNTTINFSTLSDICYPGEAYLTGQNDKARICMTVSRLREKLERIGLRENLVNDPNLGYRWETDIS